MHVEIIFYGVWPAYDIDGHGLQGPALAKAGKELAGHNIGFAVCFGVSVRWAGSRYLDVCVCVFVRIRSLRYSCRIPW